MLNDIAMCMSTICHLRAKCLRHAESGSKPHPTRQTYGYFDVDYVKNKTCEYFIETFEVTERGESGFGSTGVK